MHLLYDENGNPIPHGAHDEHHHHHDHHHEGEDCGHACNACGSEEKCKDENLALLTYMLQHNEHHAAELDEIVTNWKKPEWRTPQNRSGREYPISRKAICACPLH